MHEEEGVHQRRGTRRRDFHAAEDADLQWRGEEPEPEALPSWAARHGGPRETALAAAGPLHQDELLTRPRFKPVSSEPEDPYAGEISLAAYAPPPAARVLRRMRDNGNLRFRSLHNNSVDWIPVLLFVGILFVAWWQPWASSSS